MSTSHTHPTPLASVIIPTHNRSGQLRIALEALTRQSLPAGEFEVIVVADGCTDDTATVVGQFYNVLQVQFIEQPASGPAAARNRGAEAARAPLLIFLDDDIEAQPLLVETHLHAHANRNDLVLIGYLPPVLQQQKGFFRAELLGWWEIMFQKMRAPGYRFAYSDLLSGNFSIKSSLFQSVGKFNADFRIHEDYELGVRLHRRGAAFAFSDEAAGFHHETTDLSRSLRRKYEEGISDTQLGRLYPELRPTFLMTRLQRYSLLPSRILQMFAFSWPGAGDRLARFFQHFLAFFERVRALRPWQRLLYGLLGYWYWRGVAEELDSRSALKAYLSAKGNREKPAWSILEVDLAEGIERAEELLDKRRPDGLRLRFDSHPIGFLPPKPGGEKLRAAHLRPLLIANFSIPLLRTLALKGELGFPEITEHVIGMCNEAIQRNPPIPMDYD